MKQSHLKLFQILQGYGSSRYMTIAVLKIDMSHNMVLRHQSK